MADSASIGAGNSSYQGNQNLGGGSFGSFQLNTKPIEDLAKYTMLYNKAEYDQKQKDAEAAALEIADMTSYDLTTGIDKDGKIIQDEFDALVAFGAKDNGSALDYNNKELWAEYKKKRSSLENNLRGAKVRNTMYMMRQKQIQDAKTPAEKIRLQEKLDKEIFDTDINTPLKYTDQFDVEQVQVSAAPIKKVQTTEIGKNMIGQADFEMPDMDAVINQALTVTSGLLGLDDFEKSDSYLGLTEEQKSVYREQHKAQSASGKLEPIESSKSITAAIATLIDEKDKTGAFKYRDANGAVDIDKIINESGNTLVSGVLQQAQIYNRKMVEMQGAIDNGWFRDDFGKELHFSNDAGGVKKSSYAEINWEDGVSPQELVQMRIIGQSAPVKRDIEIKQTGYGIDQQRIAAQLKGQQIGLLSDREGRDLTKWIHENPNKVAGGATTAQQQSAYYPVMKTDELVKAIGANGVKLSDLTTEQQTKMKEQINGIDSKALPNAIVKVSGNQFTITSGSTVIKVNADDITKKYYDEINTTDAGKENVQRIYYDRTKTADPSSPGVILGPDGKPIK